MCAATSDSGPCVAHPHGRGFTVLELLVVVTVFGALALMAQPLITRIRLMSGLDSAQQAVATTALRARWLSINRGQTHSLFVTNAGTSVEIRNLSNALVGSVDLTSYSVTAAPTGTSFSFSPRGFLVSSATITLTQPALSATRQVAILQSGKILAK
jgi:prepilin-type N-terminal cleavage/methylation domain-containing protein